MPEFGSTHGFAAFVDYFDATDVLHICRLCAVHIRIHCFENTYLTYMHICTCTCTCTYNYAYMYMHVYTHI